MTWTNRDSLPGIIPRTQPLTLTWTGADSATESVIIFGSSASPSAGSGAIFFCSAPAGAGSFTVPARILSALPASGTAPEGPVGFLAVGKAPLRQATEVQMQNVDIAMQVYILLQATNVNFQ